MQYTLSQLLTIVKSGFDEIFSEFDFRCVAEVVKIKQTTKVTFIELMEYDAGGHILAKCSGCIFNQHILEDFCDETKLSMADIVGQKILFSGKLSYREDRISIIIHALSSSFTVGSLQQSKQIILQTLDKEGILYKNHATQFGLPPYNIAIISAKEADGLTDFLTTLQEESVPYTYTLYETAVHGNNAKEGVYKALQDIYSQIKSGTHYSLVSIIRGGGEASGILWQNDIDIARGICYMPIPVIIAVGHTKDTSVLEDIAFTYQKTPTAAAHYIIDQYRLLSTIIDEIFASICEKIDKKIQNHIQSIETSYNQICIYTRHHIKNITEKINFIYDSITRYHPQHLLERGYSLMRQDDKILSHSSIPNIGSKIEIETSKSYISAIVESVATKE